MTDVFAGDPAKLALPDPSPTPELLEYVGARYGLPADAAPDDLGGSFNLNLRFGDRVVRVYGPWVAAERLRDLQSVRRALSDRGIPIPAPVPTADGEPWCAFGEYVVEAEEYVAGERMSTSQRLLAGMRLLGALHARMGDLQPATRPPIANHLPQQLAVSATRTAAELVRSWDPTPAELRYAGIAEELAGSLRRVELPEQLVHGDFWDNNVLFDGTDVVAVLDFDFSGVRPRIDDLALPLGYLLQDGARLEQVRALVDAYDAGSAVPLSRSERRALPYAMARMALFFLQYLTFPADDAYLRRMRSELVSQRGPACEWWLRAFRDGGLSESTFT